MRLIAGLAALISLAALVYAGDQMRRSWLDPLPPAGAVARNEVAAAAPDLPERQPPRRWPAVFGQEDKPEPQPPTPPTPPVSAAPPQPPIDSLGYSLAGLVRNGTGDWAVVAHPTGNRILKVGDELLSGVRVVEITAEGVWVDRDGDRSLLGFAEE